MAHLLDTVGSGMVSGRNMVPWHKHPNCTVVEKIKDIPQCMRMAYADWETLKQKTYLADGRETGAYALVRSDNGTILTQGRSVGPQYSDLQNIKAFRFFQPYLDANQVELDTAGCLDGGRKVWILARLIRSPLEIVKGDTVEKFLMVSNSHDGTMSVRVGFTPVRIVCGNTLAMAHSDSTSKLIRIRHSGKVSENLESVQTIINAVDAEFEATGEQFKFLASKQINRSDLEKFVKTVFKMEEKADGKLATRSQNILDGIIKRFDMSSGIVSELLEADRVFNQTQKTRETVLLDSILENFEAGKGSDIPAQRGTYWNAYNAITENLSWDRGQGIDTRLNSLWFGDSSRKNEIALQTALAMAA